MKRTPVSFSSLASIGYDAASKTLEVEFLNGGIYQYQAVPESQYTALMQADSHGRYFMDHIRNTYIYQRQI